MNLPILVFLIGHDKVLKHIALIDPDLMKENTALFESVFQGKVVQLDNLQGVSRIRADLRQDPVTHMTTLFNNIAGYARANKGDLFRRRTGLDVIVESSKVSTRNWTRNPEKHIELLKSNGRTRIERTPYQSHRSDCADEYVEPLKTVMTANIREHLFIDGKMININQQPLLPENCIPSTKDGSPNRNGEVEFVLHYHETGQPYKKAVLKPPYGHAARPSAPNPLIKELVLLDSLRADLKIQRAERLTKLKEELSKLEKVK